jgi:hypothetical protein
MKMPFIWDLIRIMESPSFNRIVYYTTYESKGTVKYYSLLYARGSLTFAAAFIATEALCFSICYEDGIAAVTHP